MSLLGFVLFSVLPCIPILISIWLYLHYATSSDNHPTYPAALMEFLAVWTVVLLLAAFTAIAGSTRILGVKITIDPLRSAWFGIGTVAPAALLLGIRLQSMSKGMVGLAMFLGSAISSSYQLILSMIEKVYFS